MDADDIRTAVEKAKMTFEGWTPTVIMFSFFDRTFTVAVNEREQILAGGDSRDMDVDTVCRFCIARSRPIFAALDLLPSVQRGGEWEYATWREQFFTGHPPQCIVERKSQGWMVFVWSQAQGKSGWYGEWLNPDPPRPNLVDAADLLFRAFGAEKLAVMYAPREGA